MGQHRQYPARAIYKHAAARLMNVQRRLPNEGATLKQLRLIILAQLLIIVGAGRSLAANIASVSADEFLSSLGVAIEVGQGVSAASYIEPLRYLGVRAIRDCGRPSDFVMLHRQTGVRVDCINEGDVRAAVHVGKILAATGALLSFEGPNEPNNWPISYNGQTGGGGIGSWAPVAQFQRALYHAVKSDPDLREYPVFWVSEVGAEVDNVGLQFLTIPPGAGTTFPDGTQYADYANVHNYVTGTHRMYIDNQAWNVADPTLEGPWDGLYVEYGITWRSHFKGYTKDQLLTLPRVTTETGWDSVSGVGGERTQGVVLVNTYLAQFKRGWRYTFIYHLRDGEGGNDHQGLFNWNSTPKLAATYIHNLTKILADDRRVASPRRLEYSIANQPSTVHDLLLQKSSGLLELVVWDENVHGSDNISLNFGGSHSKVNVYDVTVGTDPVQSLTDVSSASLTLSDHALIIEIEN
jgi:hypothetical protein